MKKKKELPPVEERKTEPAYEEESGNRIRFFRETKNVTQQQLANAVGVSRQEISNYETGNHEIKMDKAKLISEYLKVDLNTLFCSDEYENDILIINSRIPAYQRRLFQELLESMGVQTTYSHGKYKNNDHHPE
ncbi:MAG: helix-turn-helix transcriptional regulator [Solobacterium sp.]|nr:helix-turn-helix transcriptional regulator [Solobacterium sp.]